MTNSNIEARTYTTVVDLQGTCYKVLVQTTCPTDHLCDDCDFLAQTAMDELSFSHPVKSENEIQVVQGVEIGHGATVRLVRHTGRDGFMTA